MKIDQVLASIVEQLEVISVDEIKEQLLPFKRGMSSTGLLIDPGVFIYRARPLDGSVDKQNLFNDGLHYNHNCSAVRIGRANRAGQPVFYASQGKEAVFYEMRVKEGDELLIGNWQLKETLLVHTIGYTAQIFSSLGAARPCPVWNSREQSGPPREAISADGEKAVDEALERFKKEDPDFDVVETFGREFTRRNECMYKISTAIAELHLGKVTNYDLEFGGVLYPSIQMTANSDNFALLPWYADAHLVLKGVQHVRVTHRKGQEISFDELDYAVSFDKEGKVIWNGGPISKTVPPFSSVQVLLAPGFDEFGFYDLAVDGSPAHWVSVDPNTGRHVNFRQRKNLDVA